MRYAWLDIPEQAYPLVKEDLAPYLTVKTTSNGVMNIELELFDDHDDARDYLHEMQFPTAHPEIPYDFTQDTAEGGYAFSKGTLTIHREGKKDVHILNLSELTEIPLTELERLHSMEELHALIAARLAQIPVSIQDAAQAYHDAIGAPVPHGASTAYDLTGLRQAFQDFLADGEYASAENWAVHCGFVSMLWELYYLGNPVFRCVKRKKGKALLPAAHLSHDDALRISRVLREVQPELSLSEEEGSFREHFFQQLVRNPKLQRQFEALGLTASSLNYELVLTSERAIPFRKADHLYEDTCTRKHELRKFLDLSYAHPPNITYHVKNGDLFQSTTIRLSVPAWVKDERSIKKYLLTIQKSFSK